MSALDRFQGPRKRKHLEYDPTALLEQEINARDYESQYVQGDIPARSTSHLLDAMYLLPALPANQDYPPLNIEYDDSERSMLTNAIEGEIFRKSNEKTRMMGRPLKMPIRRPVLTSEEYIFNIRGKRKAQFGELLNAKIIEMEFFEKNDDLYKKQKDHDIEFIAAIDPYGDKELPANGDFYIFIFVKQLTEYDKKKDNYFPKSSERYTFREFVTSVLYVGYDCDDPSPLQIRQIYERNPDLKERLDNTWEEGKNIFYLKYRLQIDPNAARAIRGALIHILGPSRCSTKMPSFESTRFKETSKEHIDFYGLYYLLEVFWIFKTPQHDTYSKERILKNDADEIIKRLAYIEQKVEEYQSDKSESPALSMSMDNNDEV